MAVVIGPGVAPLAISEGSLGHEVPGLGVFEHVSQMPNLFVEHPGAGANPSQFLLYPRQPFLQPSSIA